MIKGETKHVTVNAIIKCDHCGKSSNVYFVWGGIDCDYTIVLCPAHRNYYIEKVFVLIANKKAQLAIREFHEAEKERLSEEKVGAQK